MTRKVQYGNYGFGYASIENGKFGTPVMMAGLVSTSNESSETDTKIPADNSVYVTIAGQRSCEASCSFRHIDKAYAILALGYHEEENGMLVDNARKKPHCIFWLSTVYDGDTGEETQELHYFYNVIASEPAVETETTDPEEEIEAQELEIGYSCSASTIAVDTEGNPVTYAKLVRNETNASLFDNYKTKVILPTDTVSA